MVRQQLGIDGEKVTRVSGGGIGRLISKASEINVIHAHNNLDNVTLNV